MKVHLLAPDTDPDPDAPLVSNEADLSEDLGLDLLYDAMSDGDDDVRGVVRRTLLRPLTDPDTIRYRQEVLSDCLANADTVRSLHDLAVTTLDQERHVWRLNRSPETVLHSSVEATQLFVAAFRQLRSLADMAGSFASDGFTEFFRVIRTELDDAYFAELDDRLQALAFRHGVLLSAGLGVGNKGQDYTLRRPTDHDERWLSRLTHGGPEQLTLHVSDRDDAGLQAIAELRDRALNLAADALAQSTDHILVFFAGLRDELAFYLGCVRLHDRLDEHGLPLCVPTASRPGEPSWECEGLYDVGLGLRSQSPVVGSDVSTGEADLVVVTGANQGGKSTFLRSVGLAQLMLGAGMFVGARSLSAVPASGVYTHFRRREDSGMNSGKLDEELARMSSIADHVRRGDVVLFNESFAATNEREGSETSRQVIAALVESGIRVVFVTHLYALSHELYESRVIPALFLQAEVDSEGTRSFRLIEGAPQSTVHAGDLYDEIFATTATTRGAAG